MIRLSGFIAGVLLAACAVFPAQAQEFPKKQPIKIVVPVPPGGGTDALGRICAEFLQRRLGQAVIVENKPGASATIGADYVAKAAPDGYTLLFTGAELVVTPAVRNDLPYNFEDFTYLIRPFSSSILLLATPNAPFNTTPELIAYMKANPGKVRYGTSGVGTIIHLGLAMFEAAAGVKGTHVPYPGSGPAYVDMLAGNIDLGQGSPPFPDGLKVLGSASKTRHPAFPDAKTLEEYGINGANWNVWWGLVAPPNLPQPIADRIIAEMQEIMKDPEAIAKIATARFKPDANPAVGKEFKEASAAEFKEWKKVATSLNLSAPK